jgi:UDP-GlcNAc:undecaprenyl-phosphate GlcNAc-1-phosphate transferase
VIPPLAAYALAFVVSLLLVPFVSSYARRLGAMARPRSDRWNERAVPILGGLAIAGGVLAGSLLLRADTFDRVALLGGMAIMVLLGLTDDLRSVTPRRRLVIEAATAAAFTWIVTPAFDAPIRIAAIAVAAVCVPVAINAVNLVDNADGLASLLSIVTAATLAAIVATVGIPSEGGVIALIIAAACLGFLVHNRPPARVFMGDSGSLMLGFGLAGCSVLIVRDALFLHGTSHAAAAMAVPLAWAVQFGDLGMVFITRLRRRASPFRGGIDHTSHRLISAGLGPIGVLVTLSAFGAIVGAVAVWLAASVGDFRLVAVAAIVLAILVAAFETVVAWRLPYGHKRETPVPQQTVPQPTVKLPTARPRDGDPVAVKSGSGIGRSGP